MNWSELNILGKIVFGGILALMVVLMGWMFYLAVFEVPSYFECIKGCDETCDTMGGFPLTERMEEDGCLCVCDIDGEIEHQQVGDDIT